MIERPGLFVYGTLHPHRAPADMQPVVQQFRAIGEGIITGQLLDLGEYPGLVLNASASSIHGSVYEVPRQLWPVLDAYEDFRPNDPANSLFLRELHTITMADGTAQQHWVYLYNRAVSS